MQFLKVFICIFPSYFLLPLHVICEEQTLRQIAYVSSSANSELSETSLYEIARDCQTRNAENGITGLLIYRDGSIWQILEGPPDAIDRVFENIKKDVRHKNIIVVLDRFVQHRDFKFWNFAFRNYSFTHMLQARLDNDERRFCSEEQIADFDQFIQQSRLPMTGDKQQMSQTVAKLITTFQRTILRYEPHQRKSLSLNVWSRPTLSRSTTPDKAKDEKDN